MALVASDLTPAAQTPATEFLSRIADDLARGPLNLPCFPDIVPRVRGAINNPRSTQDDLVRSRAPNRGWRPGSSRPPIRRYSIPPANR